jgi:hypothetical protein
MEFARLIQALSDGTVEFAVVGDIAVVHGSRHAEMMLDVCYSRSNANLGRLVSALAPFHPGPRGFPADLPFVWDEATLRHATVLTLRTDLGDIDLLAEVAGVGAWEEVKAHARQVDAFERHVPILELAALIRSKRAAGRPKDLAAIPELESLLEALED